MLKTRKHQRKFFITIFCIALAVRLAFFVFVTRHDENAWMLPDSKQYHDVAYNIAHGKGFLDAQGNVQMVRLPGYPLFLAVLYRLLHDDVYKSLYVQIFISCIIPLLIFYLVLILFPQNFFLASLACCWSAVHVGFVEYAGMLTTETLFLLFFLLFLLLFLNATLNQRNNNFFIIGIVLGIVSMIRPVGLYTLLVSLFIMFMVKKTLRNVLAFVAGWLIFVAPWLLRNFMLTGALFFHTLPGEHFLQYAAAHTMMDVEHCSYAQARTTLLNAWHHEIDMIQKDKKQKLNDYERCVVAERLAYSYMIKHPYSTTKAALIEIVKTCVGLYVAQPLLTDACVWPEYTHTTSVMTKIKRFLFPDVRHKVLRFFVYVEIIMHVLQLFGLLLFLMGLYSVVAWRKVVIITLPLMIMFVGITLAYGCARLRMPIEPLLIVFSGAGWLWMFGQLYVVKKNI